MMELFQSLELAGSGVDKPRHGEVRIGANHLGRPFQLGNRARRNPQIELHQPLFGASRFQRGLTFGVAHRRSTLSLAFADPVTSNVRRTCQLAAPPKPAISHIEDRP